MKKILFVVVILLLGTLFCLSASAAGETIVIGEGKSAELNISNYDTIYGKTVIEAQNFGYLNNEAGMTFKVKVEKTSVYRMSFSMACVDVCGIFDIYAGENKVGTFVNDRATGGWTNFAYATPIEVVLLEGEYSLRLDVPEGGDGSNVEKITITKPAVLNLPDEMGEDIRLGINNYNSIYGKTVVESANFGYLNNEAGFTYMVNTAKSGLYEFTFSVACMDLCGILDIYAGDKKVGTFVNDTATGGWSNFTAAKSVQIELPQGEYILKFDVPQGGDGMNVESITVTPVKIDAPATSDNFTYLPLILLAAALFLGRTVKVREV